MVVLFKIRCPVTSATQWVSSNILSNDVSYNMVAMFQIRCPLTPWLFCFRSVATQWLLRLNTLSSDVSYTTVVTQWLLRLNILSSDVSYSMSVMFRASCPVTRFTHVVPHHQLDNGSVSDELSSDVIYTMFVLFQTHCPVTSVAPWFCFRRVVR